jgi:uncharacterized damage-inducible protein DinB
MKQVAKENLNQIMELLQTIDKQSFSEPHEILSGSTIGQHVRHILEFYLLLVSGSFTGTINYDKRTRNKQIEEDKEAAIKTIERLITGIDAIDVDVIVKFEGDYSVEGSSQKYTSSSVGRELAYCIEHSIHHQAIIKAGLIAMGLTKLTNEQFGVAYSTIRYRNRPCAQ